MKTNEVWLLARNAIYDLDNNDLSSVRERLKEIMMITKYRYYGMKYRKCASDCQPLTGLVARQDDPTGKYKDILVYNRKLTEKELIEFNLEEING